MSRKSPLLALLALLAAMPAAAGPPWISIELPANPHDAVARDAVLLVRTYHHSSALAVPVRGTAEGIVAGKRVSRRLDLQPTRMPGVYALRGELPREGAWVLAITLEQEGAGATVLATLNGKGGIGRVEVPSNRSNDGWTVPRPVQPADIERALALALAYGPAGADGAVAGLDEAPHTGARGRLYAGVLGVPLLLGLMVRRRWPARTLPLLLAGALTLVGTTSASAKPPWIAIEYPANPHHASTRGAALLVRAYRQVTPLAMDVSGTAEGVVGGRRVSHRLELQPTNMPGVYALRGELPREGAWVLAISIAAERGEAPMGTALVTLDGRGGVAHVEVPTTRAADGVTVPRAAGAADVTRALEVAMAASGGERYAGENAVPSDVLLAGLLGLPLFIALAGRRRQRAK